MYAGKHGKFSFYKEKGKNDEREIEGENDNPLRDFECGTFGNVFHHNSNSGNPADGKVVWTDKTIGGKSEKSRRNE